MEEYITKSAYETKKVAKKLAHKITHGVVALSGDLGSGKTTFVQGFAEGLGIKDKIISPTFVLIRQHKIPGTPKILFHIDLYRLDGENQFGQIGLQELLNDSNHLILIEWAEKIKKLLPKNTNWIYFENIDDHSRKITLLPNL